MPILTTSWTLRIAVEPQFIKLACESIIGHQPANQRVTDTKYQLDRLRCLQQANDTRKHAQYTGLSTARRQRDGGRLWIETAIAGSLIRLKNGQLAFKTEDTAMHDRLIGHQCSVVEQIARGEIISAINNDIVISDDACYVGLIQALNVGDYFHIGIQCLYCFTRRLGLVLTNPLCIM